MNHGKCDGMSCDNQKKYIHVSKDVYEQAKKKMDIDKKKAGR